MNLAVAVLVGVVVSAGAGLSRSAWLGRAAYRYDDELDLQKRSTSWVLPVCAIVGALIGVAWATRPALLVVFAASSAGLVMLSAIDLDVHRLPDAWTKPALLLTPAALLVVALVEGDGLQPWWRALGMGLAVVIGFVILFVVGRGSGMGLGDVKLSPSIGALLGFLSVTHVVAWLMITFLTAGVVALILLLRGRGRRSHLAFGPYMALGAIVLIVAPGISALT